MLNSSRAVVLSTATRAHREIVTERQGLLKYGRVGVLYSCSCLSETIILFVSHTSDYISALSTLSWIHVEHVSLWN